MGQELAMQPTIWDFFTNFLRFGRSSLEPTGHTFFFMRLQDFKISLSRKKNKVGRMPFLTQCYNLTASCKSLCISVAHVLLVCSRHWPADDAYKHHRTAVNGHTRHWRHGITLSFVVVSTGKCSQLVVNVAMIHSTIGIHFLQKSNPLQFLVR